MKTDSLFYQIFLRFPDSFFDLIGQPRQQAENYQFTSQEVKQLSFRLDGLFVPLREDSQQPLYLVEVQFQPDDSLYYRLFAELFLFLRQYQPPHPWQIVVIYPHRRVEREQSLHFGEILNLSSVRRIYLDELPQNPSLGIGVIKLVVESETAAVRTAQTLIERTREEITDQSSQRQLINLIESIIIYKLPQKSREEIEAMFELSDLKQTRVYQEALAEGEERGLERGLEQGLERGLEQGERLVVENLLRVRFGELDPEIQAIISRILQLSPEEFTPLLLQCSKQELLNQFPPEKSRGN
ncbi:MULTISPECIES: Rpn family recombination-promoting nuclease/putative transposase [unclassified Microcystis]|uniref:Rpn family recombination-promoting nuclease/putative transposase n=2 Tax=Microcystis TaxID=1125 RepID=UPI00119217E2|nr:MULTISPECIES: Rpn family recombination-promoting nuclease/putative transposase [unclassified Microcystis]MCA2618356.1 Rpn family recombination-promoting nuclease/putative transposase [Microcystis sp. M099S2]MCA2652369.1 Rpn family recombination-promoting nuclease/putative transposase [Microcystis sp. M065S2]MCA2696177.1 Rpn family recombination-promoting nuclease/putative transposase [Microcystis sp. M040S2]MCA2828151.1 Rpn family recombination-promoting nuclease/putative transposase [Microc